MDECRPDGINTFVAFDLETTGLPSHENFKTRITELSLVAASTANILTTRVGLPRVIHKLTLCFNPSRMISPSVSSITGLSNEMLENEKSWDEATCDMLTLFLSKQIPPVCLVAHNGMRFDFPIVQSEIMRANKAISEEILCADSYSAFKDLFAYIPLERLPIYIQRQRNISHTEVGNNTHAEEMLSRKCVFNTSGNTYAEDRSFMKQINERTPQQIKTSASPPNVLKIVKAKRQLFTEQTHHLPLQLNSFKLKDIYKFLYGKEPVAKHRAENDAETLLECISIIGQNFVEWANANAVPFNTIKNKPKFLR